MYSRVNLLKNSVYILTKKLQRCFNLSAFEKAVFGLKFFMMEKITILMK